MRERKCLDRFGVRPHATSCTFDYEDNGGLRQDFEGGKDPVKVRLREGSSYELDWSGESKDHKWLLWGPKGPWNRVVSTGIGRKARHCEF